MKRAAPVALALALALLSAASPAAALDPAKALTQFSHRAWQVEDGLPQNSVEAIAQTPDGYLWIGTGAGLARFDGVRFVVYDRKSSPAMPNNYVQSLLVSRDGSLWIGTSGGLAHMKNGVLRGFGVRDGLAKLQVSALAEDGSGNVWIGTSAGLHRYRDGRFTSFGTKDGFTSDIVRALCTARDGSVWVGTNGGGVNRFDGTKVMALTTRDGLASDLVRALHEDRDGSMWIGSLGGLDCWRDGRLLPAVERPALSSPQIYGIDEDSAGSLWIGTYGAGLVRLAGGRLSTFRAAHGLPSELVSGTFEDREGNLWIGTIDGGLNRLQEGSLTTWSVQEGLSNDIVRGIREDRHGAIWIATEGGLNRLHDGVLTSYTEKDGLQSPLLSTILETRDGALWLGSNDGGVMRFANGRFTALTTKDGLASNLVMALHEGDDGAVWVGTYGSGVSVVPRSGGRVRATYTTRDGLPSDTVRAFHRGRDGTLWMGTNSGLARFRDGRFTSFGAAAGLNSEQVYSIHEDAAGVLWLGTNGGGLNRFDGSRFLAVTSREGLYDDVVHQIHEDGRGGFWMSGNRGVFRVARRDLERFASGEIDRVTCDSYGTADGMKSAECNGGTHPAGWRARDGRIWFPTIRGAAVIDPAHLPRNAVAPPVYVEEVRSAGRDVAAGARLAPGSGGLEIHYSAPSLRAPSRVSFRYRLEGQGSGEWVEAGTRRLAHFSALAPGAYTFRVLACNEDGVWSTTAAAFPFTLAPRFHQTRWFYGLLLLATVGAVAAAHRARVWSLQARHNELVALVDERTRNLWEEKRRSEEADRAKSAFLANMSHELRTPLNAILGYSEMLSEDLEEAGAAGGASDTRKIHVAAKHLLGLINDILDLSKIEAGKVELSAEPFEIRPLVEEVASTLRPLIIANGNRLTVDCPDEVGAMSSDLRRVRQVLFNLVSNASKFTKDGAVTIACRREGANGTSMVVFEVTDSGIGMTPEQMARLYQPFAQADASIARHYGGTGLGLAISRRLCELLGGDIAVRSEPGRGTVFTVRLPAQ